MKTATFYPFELTLNAPDVLWNGDRNYITAFFLDRNIRPATLDFLIGIDKYHAKIGSDYRDTGNEYTTIYLKSFTNDADVYVDRMIMYTDLTFTARDCHKSWETPNMVVFDDNLSCYFYVAEYEVFGMYFLLLNMDGNFYLLALDSGDPVIHGEVGGQYDPVLLNEGQNIVKWDKIEPKLEVRHDDDSGRNYAVMTAGGYDVDMGCDIYDGDSRHATMFFYCGGENNRITFDVTFESDYECDGSRLWFDGGIVARHIPNFYEMSGDMELIFRNGQSLPMREHYTQRTYYSYCDGVPEVRTPYTTPAGETIDVDGEQGYQGELRPFEVGRHTFGKSPQPVPTGGCYMPQACIFTVTEISQDEGGGQMVYSSEMDAQVPPQDGGETILQSTDLLTNYKILMWRGSDVEAGRFEVNIPDLMQLPQSRANGVIYDKQEGEFYPMYIDSEQLFNFMMSCEFRGNMVAEIGYGYQCAPHYAEQGVISGNVVQNVMWGAFSDAYDYSDITGPSDISDIGVFNNFADLLTIFGAGQVWEFVIGEETFNEEVNFTPAIWTNCRNVCGDVKYITHNDQAWYLSPTPLLNVYREDNGNGIFEFHTDGTEATRYSPLPEWTYLSLNMYQDFGTTTDGMGTVYDVNGIEAQVDVGYGLAKDGYIANSKPWVDNNILAVITTEGGTVEGSYSPFCEIVQALNDEPQYIYTGEVPNVDMVTGFTFDVEQRCGDAVLRYVNSDGSICYLVGMVAARQQEVERQSYNRHITSHTDDRVMTARPMAKVTAVKRSYILQFNDVANDAYPEDLLLSEEVELWVGDDFEPCVVDADSMEIEKSGYASNITINVIVQNN